MNIQEGIAHNYYRYICHYVAPENYEAVKKYVANPADYDFMKILNWE